MAAPSVAELYRDSGPHSSAKTRRFTYREMLTIVRLSYADESIKRGTLNALTARGAWPHEDGPAHGVICVSLEGMMLGDEDGAGNCVRRTAQRRAKKACDKGFWRRTYNINRWLPCPQCGAERKAAKCEKCGHKGRSLNPDGSTNMKEFCRPFTYEIDIEKFRMAPPPKGIRHFCARTWKEHKEAAKRGEHPNLVEMPPSVPSAAPKPEPQKQKPAAEHRSPAVGSRQHERIRQLRQQLSARVAELQKGVTSYFSRADSLRIQLYPGDEGYSPPIPQEQAFAQACRELAISESEGREILKLLDQKGP